MDKCCCLYRIIHKPKNTGNKLIELDDTVKKTLGRGEGNDVILDSSEISRQHAVLNKKDNSWHITDLSTNGIYINGQRTQKGEVTVLRDRDILEFGLKACDGPCPEYTYKFYTAVKVCFDTSNGKSSLGSNTRCELDNKESELQQERAALELVKSESERQISEIKAQLAESEMEKQAYQEKLQSVENEKEEARAKQMALEEERQKIEESLKEKLEQEGKELEDLKKEKEQIVGQLDEATKLAQDKEDKLSSLHQEKMLKLEELNHALGAKEEELADMQSKLLASQKRQMELEAGKQALEAEMTKETRQLQKRLGDDIEELHHKCRKMSDELQQAKDAARASDEQRIQDLTSQQEQLTSLLAEKEDQQARLAAASQKEQQLEAMIEEELVCAICSELFIQAMSLSCSHSFCYYCIERWKLLKSECPSCRSEITSCVRSLVLDNYIDKIVEILSEDMKNMRKELVETRKEEVKALEAEKLVNQLPPNTGRPSQVIQQYIDINYPDLASPLTLYLQRNFDRTDFPQTPPHPGTFTLRPNQMVHLTELNRLGQQPAQGAGRGNPAMAGGRGNHPAQGRGQPRNQTQGRGQLRNQAQGRGQIGNQAVGQRQIGNQAIGRGQPGNQAVRRGQTGNQNVGRGQIGNQAVGRGQIGNQQRGRQVHGRGTVRNPYVFNR